MKFSRIIAVSLTLALLLSVFPFPVLAAEMPDRLSGTNRYLTAVAISQEGWNQADTVVLARGDQYADALAGVPLAHKLDAPILLTTPDTLHAAAKEELDRLGATDVIILGGTGAVSQTVEDQLQSLGLGVERIYGSSRQGTAAAIASKVAPNGVDTAVIAYGSNFPDALAAASYAAAAGYPILLTGKTSLPQETKIALRGLLVEKTIVVGGTGVIADSVLEELPQPTRVNGANRFATSVALAEHFEVQADHFYVATGWSFADAITGSVLAAKQGTGLLLVDSSLPGEIAEYITANKIQSISALGGSGSVSGAVVAEIEALLTNTSRYFIGISAPWDYALNQPTNMDITIKGDGTGVSDFQGTVGYDITGGQGILEYKDGETWVELPLSGTIGPQEGFFITPDWEHTFQLRFTAADLGSYSATFTLYNGDQIKSSLLYGFQTAVGVAPEEFAVTRNEAMNYFGYSVGFRLTDGLTPADLTGIEVNLFQGRKLLATNTARSTLFALEGLQHTSPFNVYADFENYTEEYWNLGEWLGDALDVPNRAEITVSLKDGGEITVNNTNLTGDTKTVLPMVWNQEQKKSYDTVQHAINDAGVGETIFLAPGTHTGNLSINKSLHLVGADQDQVIIDASAYEAYGIYVKAGNVSFSNFTLLAPVQVTPHTYGFKVEDSYNLSIQDVTVKDSYRTGVDLNSVSSGVIDNVTVDGTVYGAGIAMTNCGGVTITNSALTNNAWGGVAVYGTGGGIVIGAGNNYDLIYTQGTDFNLDLTESGVSYKLTDPSSPAFTSYFVTIDSALAAAEQLMGVSGTVVLSNLEGTEYYVLEGMSIQAAVDSAQAGAQILVFGNFTEDVVLTTQELALLAGHPDSQIDGKIIINASYTAIAGFTLTSTEPGAILSITGAADNVYIGGNLFISDTTAMGIVLDTGTPTNVTIEDNTFRFLHSGVYIHRGENVTIVNNDFTDIIEGAVSIETWARNVVINDNFVYFSNAMVYLWNQYYSEELVFEDEVSIGEGNATRYVNYLLAYDQE